MLKNITTLKFRLGVLKVTGYCTIPYIAYSSYWHSTVAMALPYIISETLNIEQWHALEIWVRGHSKSLKWHHSIDHIQLPISLQLNV